MKRLLTLMIIMCFVSFMKPTQACTNFLITPGASVDGSSMISYAADSHVLFGELYHYPAADYHCAVADHQMHPGAGYEHRQRGCF